MGDSKKPSVSLDLKVQMAEAVDILNDLGERYLTPPPFLRQSVLCYKADKQNVKKVSKRSLQSVYIVGNVNKEEGLTFQIACHTSFEKRGVVMEVDARIPEGSGVRAEVLEENYDKYYRFLQKSMSKI